MLTVNSNQFSSTCQTNSRREFLRVGALGLGGLTLADLMGLKALGSENKSYGILRDKSVVVLNLQGGPTHIETFDPKMTAPSEYRAMFGEVKTSLPGVTRRRAKESLWWCAPLYLVCSVRSLAC